MTCIGQLEQAVAEFAAYTRICLASSRQKCLGGFACLGCRVIIVNAAVSKKRISPGSLKTVSIMATVLLGGFLATFFMSAVAKKMFKTLGRHISVVMGRILQAQALAAPWSQAPWGSSSLSTA